MNKNDLEDFDSNSLRELVGATQFSAFYLGYMATYYKAKVGCYDSKMKDDIQSTKNRADAAEKKTCDLNLKNLKLVE